jgi:phenylacetate-CoA ligase
VNRHLLRSRPPGGLLHPQDRAGPGSSNLAVVLRVLSRRHPLRQRDHWTREQLQAHQAHALRQLRDHAYAHSPFYRGFHAGLSDRPLRELPVLTKAMVMEHFDELVTDPAIKLAEVEAHLAALEGNQRFRGRYWVAATSGTTGRRGIFLWNLDEWVEVLASYNRSLDWAGATAGLTRRLRMAVVSSTTPWHQSARVGATVHSPWVQTLRIDSGDPLEHIMQRLDRFQPQVLVGYASMLRLLASEQLAGNLAIAPHIVFGASEVLTGETRRRINQAWGKQPFDVYAATETAGIASECEVHAGLHLFEDLVVTEVVDGDNQPVPPGVPGERILVTVLFSRTQPLIRYEMSDSITSSDRMRCLCGRPYPLIEGIQGRVEEALFFPAQSGGQVRVQPAVVHGVMDAVPAEGWQLVQEPDRLAVLLAGVPDALDDAAMADQLTHELRSRGALPPRVEVRRVRAIPRTALGKAPLIKQSD